MRVALGHPARISAPFEGFYDAGRADQALTSSQTVIWNSILACCRDQNVEDQQAKGMTNNPSKLLKTMNGEKARNQQSLLVVENAKVMSIHRVVSQ